MVLGDRLSYIPSGFDKMSMIVADLYFPLYTVVPHHTMRAVAYKNLTSALWIKVTSGAQTWGHSTPNIYMYSRVVRLHFLLSTEFGAMVGWNVSFKKLNLFYKFNSRETTKWLQKEHLHSWTALIQRELPFILYNGHVCLDCKIAVPGWALKLTWFFSLKRDCRVWVPGIFSPV